MGSLSMAQLRALRLRSHRLSAPAPTLGDAATHMTAVQSQDFAGGRWALAARTRGITGLRQVDAAFDRGELVRSWTMRGTVHTVAAEDLDWILSVTVARQVRQHAGPQRGVGLDETDSDRAERLIRVALAGGNRLTRAEFAEVLAVGGIDPGRARGTLLLNVLAMRGVVCLGPVVPREGSPSREQYIVATDDWIGSSRSFDDPEVELLVRYLTGHAPATVDEAARWAGLPKGTMRDARVRAGDRITEVAEGVFAPAGAAPRRHPAAASVIALPAFEEYYLSYIDRSALCPPAHAALVGPGPNGLVRPVIVAAGEIVGTWSHSLAAGKHQVPPRAELFDGATATEQSAVDDALARYARFVCS